MVGCVWWFTVLGAEGSLAGLGVGLFQGGRPVAVGAKVSMWGACWLAAPQGAARSVRRSAQVFTSIRQCVQFSGPMCSVLGRMCPVFGPMCPVLGRRCPVLGWRCSRGLTTRSPGAMRSGRATGCNPRPWSREAGVDALTRAGRCMRATGCNPRPWSREAGVDALARAGRCMGWEGIPRCAAFIWPSWPPRARIRPSASSIGAWWRPGSGPRWPCQPA